MVDKINTEKNRIKLNILLMGLMFIILSSQASADPLFDVSVSLFPEFGEVEAGQELYVSVKIINMGINEAKDVLIEYSIWDENHQTKITSSSEIAAVETTITTLKKIHIPIDTKNGKYLAEVLVKYNGNEASANSSFQIDSISQFEKNLVIYTLFVVFGLFIIFIIIFYNMTQKMINLQTEVLKK